MTSASPLPVDSKPCSSCGHFFPVYGREKKCLTCRKPARRPRTYKPRGLSLTPRETQICALVRRGLSNKLIAAELNLTEGTVKEYLFKLFRKVNVLNRTELAMKTARIA